MEERDLVAVPECIGNERRWALGDEFTDGSVTGTQRRRPRAVVCGRATCQGARIWH